MVKVAENRYGKSRIRLARLRRHGDHHDVREWTVQILLQGDFASCFTAGDNSKILPTDTMKNTVYHLARNSSAATIEEFAQELAAFLLQRNPQIFEAEVSVAESPWQSAIVGNGPHPTTFIQPSREIQTTTATLNRDKSPITVSGFADFLLLKTAGSAFSGFLKDSLTTLPDTRDRLFGTALTANWSYGPKVVSFADLRAKTRESLIAAFADHQSESVQHTLFAMANRVLSSVGDVRDIHITMPNKHYLLVDLSCFGQDNPNEIFVPTDEPHGYIEARVTRE